MRRFNTVSALLVWLAALPALADETISVTVDGDVDAPMPMVESVFKDTASLPKWFGHCQSADCKGGITRVVLDGPAPITKMELLSRVTINSGPKGTRIVSMSPASSAGIKEVEGCARIDGVNAVCKLFPEDKKTRVSYTVSMPLASTQKYVRFVPEFMVRSRVQSFLKDQAARSLKGLQRQAKSFR